MYDGNMFRLLINILQRPKNIIAVVIGSILLFSLFRMTPQIHIIINFWYLDSVSLIRKLEVLYQYSYGLYSVWYLFDTIVVGLLSVFTVVNIIVFIQYYKRQKKVLNKGSLLATGTGMFLGVFGVGCISCGAIVLAPLLSALGILGSLQMLPYAGRELAVIGLIMVFLSTLYLLHQLNKPLICD